MSIEPENIIDRDAQRELFEELVKFKDKARLLRIQDREGMGKSTLLRRLEYDCTIRFHIPVSLIPLEQRERFNNELALVQQIRDNLYELEFPNFDAVGASTPGLPSGMTGYLDARDAQVERSTVGGIAIGSLTVGGEGGRLRDLKKRFDAFFQDLRQVCNDHAVTLLFDSWDDERADPDLRRWILRHILQPHCFDIETRPAKLTIVLAGRNTPDFKKLWPERYSELVRENPFTVWDIDHVERFLKVNGYEDISAEEVALVCAKMKNGDWSLQEALRRIAMLKAG